MADAEESSGKELKDIEEADKDDGPVDSQYTNSIAIKFDHFFEVTKRHSSFSQEIIGGITTFLSMAYILTVNPNNLCMDGEAGATRWPSVFIATCFGSIVGTMLMAVYAKMPLAQAPGMGLNSAVGTLVAFGDGKGNIWSYESAMALGFIYALIVLVLSVVPVGKSAEGEWITLREKLFDGIPPCVRTSIPVGIGLFIALIGFEDSKLVVDNAFVLLDFVDLTQLWTTADDLDGKRLMAKNGIVCLISLIVIGILVHYRVKGSVVIGMLIGTIIAIPLHVTDTAIIAGKASVTWAFWKNFENYFKWDSMKGGIFFACFRGFKFPEGSAMAVVMNVITLGMVDLFDTMGTVVGCATKAGLNDEDGKPEGYGRTMISDSIAAIAASLFGTSSVTTFVESGTGISAGGKTGMVALTVSVAFLLSLFFLPVFAFIPVAASGAALIYVGVLMMSTVRSVDFDDVTNGLPAFLTIAMMPFTYSITKGIGLGMVSYVFMVFFQWVADMVIWLVKSRSDSEAKRPKWPIGIVTAIVSILFFVYFLVPSA
jgi:AGZA family xanthine/uracil permease-like MFS transporter